MKRIKPTGDALVEFCEKWDDADHQEKIQLSNNYGVSYDTAKHWRSESDIPKKEDKLTMQVSRKELFDTSIQSTHLDFVMFDLETSGFDADWDILLTAVIKPYGSAPIVFRADSYPTWDKERANDRQITVDISEELRRHAVVIGHYSQKFDVRFLRAKMFKYGLSVLPTMFGLDTWRIAKDNFKVSNRRARTLCIFAGIEHDEEVEGDRWMKAAFNGDRQAMDKIVNHNILDCELLEKLASRTFPFVKSIPKL